jgi:DNA repair protein RadC
MHYLIKDLNQYEKPREKLEKFGAANLTDAELLALLIRSGGKETSAVELARTVLSRYETLTGLVGVDLLQLKQIKHIDIAKAAAIVSTIEIALRIKDETSSLFGESIDKPEHIVKLLKKDLYKKSRENLFLISLNSRNKLIAKDLISIGTINETLLSPREIFRQALIRNAVAIVLAHNHPSDDPTPSDDDILATQKVAQISRETGLIFLDHIVIADNSFISMKALGVLKNSQ